MCGVAEILRKMHVGTSMHGRACGLYAGYLESKIVQDATPLVLFLFIVWRIADKEFSRNGQSLAEDHVGWGCVDVRFQRRPDCQKGAG